MTQPYWRDDNHVTVALCNDVNIVDMRDWTMPRGILQLLQV